MHLVSHDCDNGFVAFKYAIADPNDKLIKILVDELLDLHCTAAPPEFAGRPNSAAMSTLGPAAWCCPVALSPAAGLPASKAAGVRRGL